VTYVVPLCTWYERLVVHINAQIIVISHNLKSGYPLKASFVEVNRSLAPTIHFGCHQPKLINHLSRSSIRMPEVINRLSQSSIRMPEVINHLSRSSIRMPLVEA
jgi:hypothetical protein